MKNWNDLSKEQQNRIVKIGGAILFGAVAVTVVAVLANKGMIFTGEELVEEAAPVVIEAVIS